MAEAVETSFVTVKRHCCVDVVGGQRGVVLDDLRRGHAGCEGVEDHGEENSRAANVWLAVAHGWVGDHSAERYVVHDDAP
jgi:hypothetical protein